MPWDWKAMKDVLICDKLWVVDKRRLSIDFRMGKPNR